MQSLKEEYFMEETKRYTTYINEKFLFLRQPLKSIMTFS
jgi:hypothetical protein